ncbi:MAG: ABC transporter substrate-binding protein [Gammaproteobacteria bacterium]|nr:ABC transporter substrate-binding protein [Gammaproteobacteria bacterium]
MKRGFIFLLAICAGLLTTAGEAAGHKPTEISVGYFLQRPTPAQFSQATQTFDNALGLKVNWVAFENGNEMNRALVQNRIQIAFAQGHVPFLLGVSQGLELSMIGIAVGYPDNDNCIISDEAGITHENFSSLEGRKVAVEVGSVSHYRLLKVLQHLGIDQSRVEIVDTEDATAAASALQQGEVAMACASGGALRALETLGKPLLGGVEQAAIGLPLFDTVIAANGFINEHSAIVQRFMDVVEASNEQWRKNPEPMRAAIARAAQMGVEGASRRLEAFRFPAAEEQKSDAWMGAVVPAYSKDLADFFVAQGQLGKALENYDRFITTRFLR